MKKLLSAQSAGWLFGFTAFLWWGLVPVFFKALDHVPADEILAHRIAWCVPVTLLIMLMLGRPVKVKEIVSNKKLLGGLFLSTSLVSVNWYVFTWAVTHDQILATSLGYFINPIMSILMGVFFLKEDLTRWQWVAVIFVVLGVINQIVNYGEFPTIALTLATSFALYGLVKKKLNVDSMNGFLMETTIALPVAMAFILFLLAKDKAVFLHYDLSTDLLLAAGGIITAVPLIFFAIAARTIPLNGIGFMQFIAPSMTFLLATQIYKENLGTEQLLSFILIWIGLMLYLVKPVSQLVKNFHQKQFSSHSNTEN